MQKQLARCAAGDQWIPFCASDSLRRPACATRGSLLREERSGDRAWARRSGIAKRCFRTYVPHFAIRTIQELLGHKDAKTTMIYSRVPNTGAQAVRSSADAL